MTARQAGEFQTSIMRQNMRDHFLKVFLKNILELAFKTSKRSPACSSYLETDYLKDLEREEQHSSISSSTPHVRSWENYFNFPGPYFPHLQMRVKMKSIPLNDKVTMRHS